MALGAGPLFYPFGARGQRGGEPLVAHRKMIELVVARDAAA